VGEADLVLLGADSIGDAGIVNKIGSTLLAREARARGVPVIVTADRTKLLPPGFPQPLADDRPADEVWRAPAGVRVWNRYFELLGAEDVSLIVTDEGDLSPTEALEIRGGIRVPPELRSWADAHPG
jgi:translation initiation factor 2B subunit (eIF-2B alpha/beta/delta family)